MDIALDSVVNWFNLNTNEYYMAGYSAGSDVASQYVLDNPKHKMKGLIWYAPGYFYRPVLSNQTNFPPTCLCVGDKDIISNALKQVTSIRDSFAKTTIPFLFNEIAGVDHSLNTETYPQIKPVLLKCLDFIDDPSKYVSNRALEKRDFEVIVYPNPMEPRSIISYHLPVHSKITISIFDASGKEVQQILNKKQDTGEYTIPLSKYTHMLKPGLYFVNFTVRDQTISHKFLITSW